MSDPNNLSHERASRRQNHFDEDRQPRIMTGMSEDSSARRDPKWNPIQRAIGIRGEGASQEELISSELPIPSISPPTTAHHPSLARARHVREIAPAEQPDDEPTGVEPRIAVPADEH